MQVEKLDALFFDSAAARRGVSGDAIGKALAPIEYVPPSSNAVAAFRHKREAKEARHAARHAAHQAWLAEQARPPPVDEGVFAHVTPQELRAAHKIFAKKFHTRFGNVRRGFRLLDADHSGFLTRAEFRNLDDIFNLDVPRRVMDALIKLADYDNTGKIGFAEFARLMTADEVLNLKDTLSADPSAINEFGGDFPHGDIRQAMLPQVPKLRSGVKPMEIRAAQNHLMKAIAHKYESPQEAFEELDKDGEGSLSRHEIMGFLIHLNTGHAMREAVLQNLVDFVDTDHDGRIHYKEFIGVLQKENILNAGVKPGYLF